MLQRREQRASADRGTVRTIVELDKLPIGDWEVGFIVCGDN